MKMEQIEHSEKSAYKIQAPGRQPKAIIQQTENHSPSVEYTHCYTQYLLQNSE